MFDDKLEKLAHDFDAWVNELYSQGAVNAKVASLGHILSQQNIVAKTRPIKSSWAWIRCTDGNLQVHVDLLKKCPYKEFGGMTCDEAERVINSFAKEDK